MKLRYLSILAAGLLISANVYADEALAKKDGCMMCHAVGKKGNVGPDLKVVAAKFKDDAAGADKIVKAIREGSTSKKMPAQPKVSEDDAKKLASWILSL